MKMCMSVCCEEVLIACFRTRRPVTMHSKDTQTKPDTPSPTASTGFQCNDPEFCGVLVENFFEEPQEQQDTDKTWVFP